MNSNYLGLKDEPMDKRYADHRPDVVDMVDKAAQMNALCVVAIDSIQDSIGSANATNEAETLAYWALAAVKNMSYEAFKLMRRVEGDDSEV